MPTVISAKTGAVRELNPRPLAPKARIIPLDQRPTEMPKHARRDSNPQPPDSKSDALSVAPRALAPVR